VPVPGSNSNISELHSPKPKTLEVVEGWRRLHNEELYNFYVSSDIIRVIISRNMRRAGHVARMGEVIIAYNTVVRESERKDHLEFQNGSK
jgi:hypothetical protein